VTAFDPTGPLPAAGVTVLEASAGTGKTYTIAALAARYVAEGMPLDELLAVTFTRAATGELRARIRERLTKTLTALETGTPTDEVDALLLARGDVADQVLNLRLALADFDAATITTTHGFCAEVLGSLGILGDLDPGCAVVEDVDDLRDEVLADLYLRKWRTAAPAIEVADARTVARAAINHPNAPLLPDPGAENRARTRAALATAVRAELEVRKRANNVMTFDDQLERLRAALDEPAVAARLRARFSVVLVDEFQDTDPVQWEVLRRAFVDGAPTAVVLIGDPKQAIYAFRGADVFAYLEAKRAATQIRTLETNWRSDQALIDAHDALLAGRELGDEDIAYASVKACDAHQEPRLTGAPAGAPLRFRVLDRGSPRQELTRMGFAETGSAREFAAQDCANDIARLLGSAARFEGRPVRPGDVAVLVRKTVNAVKVQHWLAERGIPAVLAGAGSVFATPAATDWLRLLEALERPSQTTRARAAVLTAFFGWDGAQVAAADDDAWEDVHGTLHRWARILRGPGVAALLEAITLEHRLAARILGVAGGERLLTDLRHVGQLLHAAARRDALGAPALTSWLRRRVDEGLDDGGDEERTRRLESDDEAVQLLTIHRAKGLEWPVVYVPDLWDAGKPKAKRPAVFHDETGVRRLDVGLEGPDFDAHVEAEALEGRGEDLRLLYVALTRAKAQCVVWWAGAFGAQYAPLTLLVCGRPQTPPDETMRAALEEVAARAPGCVAVELGQGQAAPHYVVDEGEPGLLSVRTWERDIDLLWRRASYSSLTRAAHEAVVASEPEDGGRDDEPPADEEAAAGAAGGPLADMPGGRSVGTAIHRVLEQTDFAAPDLEGALGEALAWWSLDLGDREQVVAGLAAVLRTPLAPLGGVALAGVARTDRLDELEFELPLAGGDQPTGVVRTAALARVLREHGALGAYAERLDELDARVRGFLTGSIDLVVRLADGRWAIADYKTNRLASYGPGALAEEMERQHYGLQALLYAVALHRFLRWRLPGYDPDRDLAGVLYLFVRGMPDAGVWSWRPDGALLDALSEVLDGA
jgi:exodeoxyribonuclease V beta subunit